MGVYEQYEFATQSMFIKTIFYKQINGLRRQKISSMINVEEDPIIQLRSTIIKTLFHKKKNVYEDTNIHP